MPRLFTLVLVALATALSQEHRTIRTPQGRNLELYPANHASRPELPSPFQAEDGTEVILAVTKDGHFALVPVTLRDRPLQLQWEVLSGDQHKVDADDFPTLARTGLHAERELNRLKTITGRPVSEITELGRPMRASAGGFMAEDEDVVSVLKGDNALVARMRLTHPKLARPLFHVWNLILKEIELGRFGRSWNGFEHVLYQRRKVQLSGRGTKCFQESIFNDEIRGTCDLQIRRELAADEKTFLAARYTSLGPEKTDELVQKLCRLRVGEMQAYYIMRYGFYEGHTLWRADPIAIAFIFGLRSLEELEKAFSGRLYRVLTDHHTEGGDIK
jgi:hypothetical protein